MHKNQSKYCFKAAATQKKGHILFIESKIRKTTVVHRVAEKTAIEALNKNSILETISFAKFQKRRRKEKKYIESFIFFFKYLHFSLLFVSVLNLIDLNLWGYYGVISV